MIDVIELDQFSSCADNLEEQDFDTFDIKNLQGKEPDNAKKMFGGIFRRFPVWEYANPPIGRVWYTKNQDTGKMKQFKVFYDTSD